MMMKFFVLKNMTNQIGSTLPRIGGQDKTKHNTTRAKTKHGEGVLLCFIEPIVGGMGHGSRWIDDFCCESQKLHADGTSG
jgi:hypothetical protein